MRLVRLLCAAMLIATAIGCNEHEQLPPARSVRVGVVGIPESISPPIERTAAAAVVENMVFRSYLGWTANGSLHGDWATDVPSSASRTFRGNARMAAYQLRLRKDATWSDGVTLTNDDFLFAYRTAVHPLFKKRHAYWTAYVKGLTVAGTSLTYTFARSPVCDTLALLPLPRHLLESTINQDPLRFVALGYHQAPVGNGPYKIKNKRWNGTDIELQANPFYTQHPPSIDSVSVHYLPTIEQAWEALYKNTIDVLDEVPLSSLSNQTDNNIEVRLAPGPRLVVIAFNTREGPLSDVWVRRALAHAVEPEKVVKTLGKSKDHEYVEAIPTFSWLQPTRFAYVPAFATYKGNRELAQRILRSNGWTIKTLEDKNKGKKSVIVRGIDEKTQPRHPDSTPTPDQTVPAATDIDITCDADSPDMNRVAEALSLSWDNNLGLKAVVRKYPHASYVARLHQGAFTVALQALEVYPWTEPAAYFSKESVPTETNYFRGENVSGWSSPASQQLLARIAAEASPTEAAPSLADHQRLLAREVPILPLYFTPLATAFRSGLLGIQPRTFGEITWNVEEWSWK